MFTLLFRLLRIVPFILGLFLFLRRGKKNAALDDDERKSLTDDIEALTVIAEAGEADDRKAAARETAERLRAAQAREQVNQGALKNYKKRREALGARIAGNAATDKRYDAKLRDLREAAGKLAGNG